MKRKKIYLLSLVAFVACATPRAPTGGPKDQDPPKVLSTSPDSAALNFNKRTIEVEFDEYFVTQNLQSQLIFSPPLKYPPTFKTKKKSLIIELKDTLKPNTTYNLHFGEGIKDLNEGNVLKNFQMVFSTGSVIDSFSLSGQLINAQTGEPEENVKVLLFREFSDSNIFLHTPYYVANTNKQGQYQFNHITNDSFYLFAIKDVNNNYKFEKDELIGFAQTLVYPDSTHYQIRLAAHTSEDSLSLKSSSINSTGQCIVLFNKDISSFKESIRIDHNIPGLNKNSRTDFYLSSDSLFVYLPASSRELDTLNLRILLDSQVFEQKLKMKNFKQEEISIAKFNQAVSPDKPLQLKSNNALRKYNSQKMKLLLDSNEVTIESINQIQPSLIQIQSNLREGKTYKLVLFDSAIADLNSQYNTTDTIEFSTLSSESTGSIKVNVSCETCSNSQPAIVYLKKGDKIIEEKTITSSANLELTFITPGKYSLSAYRDLNANGRWDEHNFLSKIQAEPWYFGSKDISVRPNWEVKDAKITID